MLLILPGKAQAGKDEKMTTKRRFWKLANEPTQSLYHPTFCIAELPKTITICEKDRKEISCSYGGKIQVINVNFGRPHMSPQRARLSKPDFLPRQVISQLFNPSCLIINVNARETSYFICYCMFFFCRLIICFRRRLSVYVYYTFLHSATPLISFSFYMTSSIIPLPRFSYNDRSFP